MSCVPFQLMTETAFMLISRASALNSAGPGTPWPASSCPAETAGTSSAPESNGTISRSMFCSVKYPRS